MSRSSALNARAALFDTSDLSEAEASVCAPFVAQAKEYALADTPGVEIAIDWLHGEMQRALAVHRRAERPTKTWDNLATGGGR